MPTNTFTSQQPSVRIAIVTGAAQGIGEAVALKLADDGLDVAVTDLPQKREQLEAVAKAIKAKGRRSIFVTGDVSVEKDVIAIVDTTVQVLGGLDVMVANAGIYWKKSFLESTTEEFDRMMTVNVRSVMLCFKYAAKQMIAQGRGGRILGAASIAGKQGFAENSAYCASKFAIRGLGQAVAAELRPYNITVNTYAPGIINTAMTTHPDDLANGGAFATILKSAGLPVDFPVPTPSVIADLVSYLAKPEAFFVTGQSISVNGGVFMD